MMINKCLKAFGFLSILLNLHAITQFYTDVATYQLWQNSTGHRVYHCKTYYRIEIQIMYELVKR